MIHYKEYKHIDKARWDKCIEQSVQSDVYAYSWYLDAVCENWGALILNDYEAVMPLAHRSKFGINYVFQPFFTRYFGVYSKKEINQTLALSFLSSIPKKFKLIEISVNERTSYKADGFTSSERRYQRLDLNVLQKDLVREFSENTKRNIKKANTAQLTIVQGIEEKKIVELFKETKGEELKTFKKKDYETMLRLTKTISKHNFSESFAVYNQKQELLAAAFFIKTEHRLIYLKGGVSQEGRSSGAMHFLFNYFINKHSNSNYTLDFGGSSVDSVARFYKSFGAKDCVYLQLKKNSLSRVVRWLSNKND